MAANEQWTGLVADIGGTNARLALVRNARDRDRLGELHQFKCRDFKTFENLLEHYLEMSGIGHPLDAVLSVAGPVERNAVRLTNGVFKIDGNKLERTKRLGSCRLLNDFAALALALPVLGKKDLRPIGPALEGEGGMNLVVGPGTGLGAGFLVQTSGGPMALEGEGGHISFAPHDDLERCLLDWFRRKYGRVSMERLLSGPGLEDLFAALGDINGTSLTPQDDVSVLRQGLLEDGLERQVLTRFCALLGSFAGDLALVGGAWHGVYIGGGIVPRMADFFAASPFRERFEAKGRYGAKLAKIPTYLITADNPALQGAASQLP